MDSTASGSSHHPASPLVADYVLHHRAFPGTFKGPTYRWFVELQPGSITSFEDLKKKFVAQHCGNTRVRKGTESLFAIKQNGDTLRNYTTKFTEAMQKISDLNTTIAICAYSKGLDMNTPLAIKLNVSNVKCMEDLLTKAQK